MIGLVAAMFVYNSDNNKAAYAQENVQSASQGTFEGGFNGDE